MGGGSSSTGCGREASERRRRGSITGPRRSLPPPSSGSGTSHDPAKWEEFKERYFAELDRAGEGVERLRKELAGGPVTFVYSSKEQAINNAEALRLYLENRSKKGA